MKQSISCVSVIVLLCCIQPLSVSAQSEWTPSKSKKKKKKTKTSKIKIDSTAATAKDQESSKAIIPRTTNTERSESQRLLTRVATKESAIRRRLGSQVYVVKAAKAISRNTPLDASLVKYEPVSMKNRPSKSIRKDTVKLYWGQKLCVNVPAGAMILTSDLCEKKAKKKRKKRKAGRKN